MSSQWIKFKSTAIDMRKNGYSIGDIERKYGIAKSTLSGWLRDIKLTDEQINTIGKRTYISLAKARKKAILWHNKQKDLRIKTAHEEAIGTLKKIDVNDNHILELALAMLYLGEGSKDNSTSIGNTNPLILKFFISSMIKIFGIDKNNIACELHLRSDQGIDKMIRYWSKELNISKGKFCAVKDKRQVKSKTYPNYHGVCVVRCAGMAMLRRIVHLGEEFSKIVVSRMD